MYDFIIKEICMTNDIEVIKMDDISSYVATMVKGFLDHGFKFYFISGSQGELEHYAFTKDGGKTVFVIWVYEKYEKVLDDSDDVLHITCKKYIGINEHSILWMSEGEVIDDNKFYRISSRKKVYVKSIIDYERVNLIRHGRVCDRFSPVPYVFSDSAKKVAYNIIKNRKGYKSVKLSDILRVIRTSFGYGIIFTPESKKANFYFRFRKI